MCKAVFPSAAERNAALHDWDRLRIEPTACAFLAVRPCGLTSFRFSLLQLDSYY